MSVQQDRKRWLALAVIVAAQFMVVLDVAIVNVALPSIKTDLHFNQENLQWVITAYSILFGGVLLLGGRLADRRPRMVGGLADRVPLAAGARGRAGVAGGALHPHDHVCRGARAQPRAGHLGRGLGERSRRGRAARRRADER